MIQEKMKTFIYGTLLLFFLFGSLTACKKENCHVSQNTTPKTSIDGRWNLMRIQGGISGANESHFVGEIIWKFNTQNATLTVNNTVGNSTIYSLPSGTYPFQQISDSTGEYLVINGYELGQMTFSGNQLVINENVKSTGEGACGFYLTLQR